MRVSRKAKIAFFAVMSALTLAAQPNRTSQALMQNNEGALDLLVIDPQGAVCARANAHLTGDGGLQFTGTTNDEGRLRMSLAAGTYTLNISLAGFQTYEDTIVISQDKTLPWEAKLRVGSGADSGPGAGSGVLIPVLQDDHPLMLEPVAIPELRPVKSGLFKRLWHRLFSY